ncbi:adenylate/guanylate cyclase domain-containing protein [Parashewanella spongiae]|uniref:Adenylate/guanylate cyclase domain-containing protein n=2 Tax=Parashewanella spongiae TaxID=342950 RepID=A0A3A6TYU9_9GAMM|nr:adenylate/guanylate cyclase domain-containing protein [Parashewanella spongiae]
MRISHQIKKLAFAITAWIIAMSIFVFFRYAQTDALPHWATSTTDLKTLAFYVGIIFGCLHWISNLVVDFSVFSRLPYICSLFIKGLLLLIGALCIASLFEFMELWHIHNHMATLWKISTTHVINSHSFQLLLIYLIFIRFSLAFIEQTMLLIGCKELINIGLGKYHKPRYEQRLFVYLDMTDSTAHAESLGDYRFSCLIQDCFKLLADPVSQSRGEIYRYMGDAVFIHWPVKNGVMNQRCLKLYYDFNQILSWHGTEFRQRYGFVPQFKAAVHCGQVVTAVVGVQKQEISFFSDVLNTLARLQDQCSLLSQQLLVSAAVAMRFDSQQQDFDLKDLGQIKLKGKQHSMQVYGVNKIK